MLRRPGRGGSFLGMNDDMPTVGGGDESGGPKFRARVPESVARGVFSTGALVIGGPNEYVIDFVVRLTRPYQVVARVVMPPTVMGQLVKTLADNVEKFRDRFGEPAPLPDPNTGAPATPAGDAAPSGMAQDASAADSGEAGAVPAGATGGGAGNQQLGGMSVRDIYDELKVSDEILTGSYANAVMIGHGPSEFCFDFITSFMPNPAVTERVYMAAPQAIRLLQSMRETYQNHERKSGRAGPPPDEPGPEDDGSGLS